MSAANAAGIPPGLKIDDTGNNNRIEISGCGPALKGVIRFQGNDSHVRIGPRCSAFGLYVEMRSNSTLVIGERCHMSGLKVHCGDGGLVEIGDQSTFLGISGLYVMEPGTISLGRDCLVAAECWITVSDMHSIIDVASGERINPARDVRIAEHVWLARGVAVLKGSVIGRDTVIGANATVAGEVPAGVVAVGSPARVIRSGVTWDAHRL